jgi:hypothetical protein
MKIKEVEHLMAKTYEKDSSYPHPCWAFVDAVPHGIIETQEQYDYIKYYSDNTSISMDGMKSFEEDCGRYLNLGNYFGGAAFYFCTQSVEYTLECIKKYPNIYPETTDWSWGKYGKIEFEEGENQ